MSTAPIIDVGLFGSMSRYGDLGVHGVLDLRRSFSRDELARAVERTAADFPVLDCVYRPGLLRDRWVRAEGPASDAVHVAEGADVDAATLAWTGRPIDPTRERCLRVTLIPRASGCRLIVSLSHLAVDGAGMAAVGHVLGSHLYGERPMLPIETERSLGRALDGLTWVHLPVLARDLAKTLVQPLRVFLSGRRERPYPEDGSPGLKTRELILSAAEIEELRRRCGGRATVNDLLVAAMARVGARRSDRGAVPVLYTIDLRRFSRAPHLSAANVSSFLTAFVPREATRDFATAAAAARAITDRHRKSLLGPAFVLLPVVLSARTPHAVLRSVLPFVHKIAVDLPVSRGLLFTNVGKIDAGLGPFARDIESLRVVGPNVRGVPIPAVVAYGLHGRVHLSLFAPPGLSETAVHEMEKEILEALELVR